MRTRAATESVNAAFRISPLVRYTLFGLLVTLVTPLPFLQVRVGSTVPLWVTLTGIALGALLLTAALSQRVETGPAGVRVRYARWVPSFFARGWQVAWSDIQQILTRPTGQGGRVHYLVNGRGDRFLLPMRIAGFARFLRILEAQTGIDTTRIKPLAQPWMYMALLVCVVIMGFADLWILSAALDTPP